MFGVTGAVKRLINVHNVAKVEDVDFKLMEELRDSWEPRSLIAPYPLDQSVIKERRSETRESSSFRVSYILPCWQKLVEENQAFDRGSDHLWTCRKA